MVEIKVALLKKKHSYQQLEYLKRYKSEDINLFPEALDFDEILSDVAWLPLPGVKIEPDDWNLFHTLWHEQKLPMVAKDSQQNLWDGLCIWKNPKLQDSEVYHPMFPQKIVDWSSLFPKMFEKINRLLPYEEIWKITLATNHQNVPIHVDPPRVEPGNPLFRQAVLNPWPNSLRIFLEDPNVQSHFYLTEWPQSLLKKGLIRDLDSVSEWGTFEEVPKGQRCYVDLPKNTNAFVFSNGRYLHGADYFGVSKILLLVWGKPEAARWKEKLKQILQEIESSDPRGSEHLRYRPI